MPRGKDLRSFKPRRDQIDPELQKQAKKMGASNKQMEQAQRLNEQMDQYKDKSEQELIDDLLHLSREQKQKGQLDDGKINKMKDSVWPMLNEEQRKKLLSLLEMMKKQ